MNEKQLREQNHEVNQESQPDQSKAEWYAVHTYSGYENKVRLDLAKRIESMHMQDKIFEVLIPEEDGFEIKNGKKKAVKRHLFPGYVLVHMIFDNESWYVVHHTPGVTGFVGAGIKAIPLRPQEVEVLFEKMGLQGKRPVANIDVQPGESVRISAGPFESLEGTVLSIDSERGKLKVSIAMFGRETAVELEYDQIEKI